MSDIDQVEYRVRKVERYIVTRYVGNKQAGAGSLMERGEYQNEETAFEVAYALCKAEHEQLGWPLGDERIQYPKRFDEAVAA